MDKIESVVINDSGFAFDPFTGETYTINETGVLILRKMRGEKDLVKMANVLSSEYEVSFETAYTDLLEFRTQLRLYGLIS